MSNFCMIHEEFRIFIVSESLQIQEWRWMREKSRRESSVKSQCHWKVVSLAARRSQSLTEVVKSEKKSEISKSAVNPPTNFTTFSRGFFFFSPFQFTFYVWLSLKVTKQDSFISFECNSLAWEVLKKVQKFWNFIHRPRECAMKSRFIIVVRVGRQGIADSFRLSDVRNTRVIADCVLNSTSPAHAVVLCRFFLAF